jgi:deoxyribodipyrimidine photo-lyase
MDYDDSDVRHWRFIYESILDLQSKLNPINRTFYYFHNEVQTVFSELVKNYDIKTVFSHQEIGNKITFDRDMHGFFKKQYQLERVTNAWCNQEIKIKGNIGINTGKK